MRDEDIDIVDLIIKKMPEKTKEQEDIKFYMKSHKTLCNDYLYQQFSKETTFFNTILKSLMLDLGREINMVLCKDKLVTKMEE